MNQLKCPHCGEHFTVNETDYNHLLEQVRGQEFDREIHERLERETALLKEAAKGQLHQELALKDQEIERLKNQQERSLAELTSQKDFEISQLHHQIQGFDQEKELIKRSTEQTLLAQINQKELEVQGLKAQLEQQALVKDQERQLATATLEKERDDLHNQLLLQGKERELELAALKKNHDNLLKAAQEQVEFYKNFKAQQSTKAIGESLEAYAEMEFNKVRAYAFPRSQFGKDNLVSDRGSKGDFIFREADETGVEFISIMFEMKNEADTTKTKHKNADFFKELDKDRREKGCEYAVLVSMLEADNDYYNTGIVDVSHAYPKMYVVRPQFFIQLIGLLRNAALNSLQYKQELALIKSQNIDITNFEEDLNTFKQAFAKNYNSASNNFQKAIEEIDKAIKRMEEVKRFLTTSENQLRLANNKLDDVSVKKLTRKNPTMKAKFDALRATSHNE